ncbi:MAG: FecR domain-containing protein, partial [Candidatus Omnitrophica bacterium]|nr:FecR domain-containing protein [Candidatus Omnitrophota bacterium]
VSGQVEWQQAGSDLWEPAMAQHELTSGDKLRTSDDGRATLTLDEGSTIELSPGSEFVIQSLSEDVTGRSESIFGIWAGSLTAQVMPMSEGSVFQFETPTTTVNVVGTTLTITINPDGSVTVKSDEGTLELSREGDSRLRLELESGEEVLVEYDPGTGVLRVTSLSGTFDVVGPDNVPITLADGDTAVWSGGAATFIPGTPPVGDAPAADTLGEPVS